MGSSKSRHEENAILMLRAAGLPDPEREYWFAWQAMRRKWRFDFAWPGVRLAVEIEGGTWQQGRHTRGKGYRDDCEKYNAAVMLGWRVLRFTPEMLGDLVTMVRKALAFGA